MCPCSVLSSCLYHLLNEALTRKQLTPDLVVTLTQILEVYVLSWQQQEAELRAKEEEESSLYRFKSQVHGDERSEEEKLEAEFRESFPEFTQVYTIGPANNNALQVSYSILN